MMFAQVVKFCCLCTYSDVNVIIICIVRQGNDSFVLLTRQNELFISQVQGVLMAHGVAATSTMAAHGSATRGPSIAQASAVRALQQEFKKLKEEPVEGFLVQIPDDANMFEWEVAIFGSPGSLYEGGYFKASCHF